MTYAKISINELLSNLVAGSVVGLTLVCVVFGGGGVNGVEAAHR